MYCHLDITSHYPPFASHFKRDGSIQTKFCGGQLHLRGQYVCKFENDSINIAGTCPYRPIVNLGKGIKNPKKLLNTIYMSAQPILSRELCDFIINLKVHKDQIYNLKCRFGAFWRVFDGLTKIYYRGVIQGRTRNINQIFLKFT